MCAAPSSEAIATCVPLKRAPQLPHPKYVPGVYQYHDLLVSNVDMKRLLDAHGHLIRVVSYEHFKTTSRCRWRRLTPLLR